MGVAFAAIAVVAATNPLPGEEEYLGRSFADVRAADPQLGNVIWHDYVAFGTLLFGVSILIAYLAWRGWSTAPLQAWSSILVLSLTIFAVLVLAHVPIGNTSLVHFWVPVVLSIVLLLGVAVTAPSVFHAKSGGSAPRA